MEVFSTAALARFLGVSVGNVESLRENADLPFFRKNGKIVYRRDDVMQWLEGLFHRGYDVPYFGSEQKRKG